jgi:hypothetical protein
MGRCLMRLVINGMHAYNQNSDSVQGVNRGDEFMGWTRFKVVFRVEIKPRDATKFQF